MAPRHLLSLTFASALVSTALLNTETASAAMRCNGNVIRKGTTLEKLSSSCPNPLQEGTISRVTKTVRKDGSEMVNYDESKSLLFSTGEGDLLRHVVVADGRVAKVQTLARRGRDLERGESVCKESSNPQRRNYFKKAPRALVIALCGAPDSEKLVTESFEPMRQPTSRSDERRFLRLQTKHLSYSLKNQGSLRFTLINDVVHAVNIEN